MSQAILDCTEFDSLPLEVRSALRSCVLPMSCKAARALLKFKSPSETAAHITAIDRSRIAQDPQTPGLDNSPIV